MALIGSPIENGKGKATRSGARKWLVGFGFLAIRSEPPDGGPSIFFKEFKAPTAIHRRWRPKAEPSLLWREQAGPPPTHQGWRVPRHRCAAAALTACRQPGEGSPSDEGSK